MLVERGAQVLTCGRDEDNLRRAATAVPGLMTVTVDLAEAGAAGRLVDEATARLGGLSMLVNNAAVQYAVDWVAGPPERTVAELDQEMSIDLLSPLRLVAHALPLLRREPDAVILNVTSGLAVTPKRSAPVYCAAKAGLRTFTTALRYQTERDAPHVRVVEAMLPLVDTPMTAGRGRGKITADEAATAIVRGLDRGADVIPVGKVPLFLALHRLAPRRAARMLRDG
jgi:short-subunit dehydrogenase involved in D-alanine esterification of teichoic acids